MKHNVQPYLSIITPIYNRAHLISRCYESLNRQTVKEFEWIIIDDGSNDSLDDVVNGFSSDYPILFLKKSNGGKHTALNISHEYIHGRYVCILDSDDYLTDNAVEKIIEYWNQYDSNKEIGIVTFLKGSSIHKPSCMAHKKDEGKPVDIMRYHRECIYSADACEVIRSELFKKYPFPVFEGENFVSEGALWNRVSFTHKCVYINQVIYIADYIEGGLTKSGRRLRVHNPKGGMYTANLNMNRKNYLSKRIKNGLLYTCYGFFAKCSPLDMARHCDSKILMWCCMPFGYLLYMFWKNKYF